MRIGVDYYPEWEDEQMWRADAARMKELGISIVRIAEFAWSRIEPKEDQFVFDWLEQVIAIMSQHEIDVVLGTPTSAPPNWLMEAYPDVYLVSPDMRLRYQGVRGHRCVNSTSLRERTKKIVQAMAERFGHHPSVIGWQTDNEFEMTLCNCSNCNRHFREWVRRRYGTLDAVNQAWGTVVWSGEYGEWSEIHTPRGGQAQLNPSFQLDYHRFQNESIAAYQQLQIDILRKHCPQQFITHNLWESPLPIDYRHLFEPLDFASADYYITSGPERLATSPYSGAYFLDQTRGLKRENFWIMETITGGPGGGCWGGMGRTPAPGFMRAVMWQSISRGADNIVQFLWRAATAGSEQLSTGIMFHSNRPPAYRTEELEQVCREVTQLSERLDGTQVKNETALLYSHEIHRAFQIQPHTKDGLNYDKLLKSYHKALVQLGAGTDVLSWKEDFSEYKLVVAPYLFLMDSDLSQCLMDYAKNGGTLILTCRSGIKNMNNIVCPMQPPGLLSECIGGYVEEWDALSDAENEVQMNNGVSYRCSQWADFIIPESSEAMGWYKHDFYAGKAAVTVNQVGEGRVYYIGAIFEEPFLLDFFQRLAAELEIRHMPNLPTGVQAAVRESEDQAYLFLTNFTREEQRVVMESAYPRLLSQEKEGKRLRLQPFGVEILQLR